MILKQGAAKEDRAFITSWYSGVGASSSGMVFSCGLGTGEGNPSPAVCFARGVGTGRGYYEVTASGGGFCPGSDDNGRAAILEVG